MRQTIRNILLFLLAAVLLVIPVSGYDTPEGYVSSLYHNDEAWYKDSMAPLLVKDGVYHIPADILEMFPGITVQEYEEKKNLLIHNTNSGSYASIVYSTASAAVNGEIVGDVDIFRQEGYYYIGAEWIAGICGLECTFQKDRSGNMLLRLTNGEQRRSFDELVDDYTSTAEQEETKSEPIETVIPEDDHVKKIYLVCTDTPGTDNTPAALLKKNGLAYTEFLVKESGPDRILADAGIVTGGVFAEDGTVIAAEQVNDRVQALLCRRLPMALLPDDGDTEAFKQAGYIPIIPDFTVNYQTDPDVVFEDMLKHFQDNDHAVLQVGTDGCSQRILVLLKELLGWNENYKAASLTEWE